MDGGDPVPVGAVRHVVPRVGGPRVQMPPDEGVVAAGGARVDVPPAGTGRSQPQQLTLNVDGGGASGGDGEHARHCQRAGPPGVRAKDDLWGDRDRHSQDMRHRSASGSLRY